MKDILETVGIYLILLIAFPILAIMGWLAILSTIYGLFIQD